MTESKKAKQLLTQYIDCVNEEIVASFEDEKSRKFIARHLRQSKSFGEGNLGTSNHGYRNTGSCNLGDFNAGLSNAGDYNSGYQNVGDNNAGRFNTGDFNAGGFNLGDFNAGIFNTGEPGMRAFNRETSIKYSDWINIEEEYEFYKLQFVDFVHKEDMTPREKEAHPEYRTMGGYLKRIPRKTAWARWWKEHKSVEMEKKLKGLPNFDRKIFKEITGIDIK